ncbi:MAG: hypothetical protein K6F50_10470, partial [Kiritimatiellae bacterium]|nr:hypothetical protein [Kiritimatiellia bacterium]
TNGTASSMINMLDSKRGTITITGGSFYGFDPANVSEGTITSFLPATGYVSEANNPSEGWYTVHSAGYNNGADGTFTIAAAKEALLVDALPAGKTLASTVSETSSLTYAQAYALGLWDETKETVADLDATITVAADGKVTVTLANEPATGYTVTCNVYEKGSLTADWPTDATQTYAYGSETAFTPGSSTAGFYKVAVVISNAQ